MIGTQQFLRQCARNIKVFFATLLFLIAFPFILVLFFPIYTYRFIINRVNSLVNPKEGKILSTKSAVFAADDIYGKPKCPLLVLFLFNGKMTLERLRDKVDADMVGKKKDCGALAYPELQQYISKWMGFYFWRWDKHFNVANHVQLYSGAITNVCNEENVPILVNELTVQPFKKGQSPWEIFLVTNVNIKPTHEFYCSKDVPEENKIRDQSIAIFRLHHSLADGISIRHLLLDVADYIEDERNLNSRGNPKFPFFKAITYPLRVPFETIGALLDCLDTNAWHLPEEKLTGEFRSAASVPVSVDFIKGIKNSYDGVTFAGVVLAAVAGGIRNFMIKRGTQVPEKMHCLTPLPMPGHSAKLRNHLTAAAIALPLGEPEAAERLSILARSIKKLKSSVVPETNYCFYPIFGGLFPFMAKRLFRHTFTTALLSSFEGPRRKIQFLGHNVDDIVFAGGLLMGNMGVGLTLLSYNGSFRIVFGADSAILHEYEDAKEIVQLIYEELFILQNLNIV